MALRTSDSVDRRHAVCRDPNPQTSEVARTNAQVKLGIGVCARDEEVSIITTLASIVDSAQAAPVEMDWELIVCANGCSDRTVDVVRQWLAERKQPQVALEILERASLVEAQRHIATRLKFSGADLLAFFDADVLVDAACISELIRTASSSSVKAAYALSAPIVKPQSTLVERMLNHYDSPNTVFSERKHLHGRAFVIKEWSIPVTTPPLLADDIYLSCSLLYSFGPDAIAISPKATVYFHQITSVADFYSAYKRRSLELSRCLSSFPHFLSLPAEQLNRRMCWMKLLNEPPSRAVYWLVLIALRKSFDLWLWFETHITRRSAAEWKPTLTSKKTF